MSVIPRDKLEDRTLLLAYFLSGAVGLVYQVVWARALALRFGSDVVATSIVLAVFMGGLALGSGIGALVSDRVRRPLLLYGFIEIGIGLLGLAITPLLELADPVLGATYRGWFETSRAQYEAVRVGVAAIALLPPTTLMGMTLPLILRYVVADRDSVGSQGARFYAINTLGAISGTLGAGFFLIPFFGVTAATRVAVATNLLIGVTCAALGLAREIPDAAPVDISRVTGEVSVGRGRVLLLVAGSSGFAALALEVLWTRCLMLSFGATVYSFSIMLVCFLFGLSLGSSIAGKAVDRVRDAVALLARLELLLGCVVAIVLLALEGVPWLFGALFGSLGRLGQGTFPVALVLAPFVVSLIILAIPTCLLGATFPAAVRAYGDALGRVGAAVGRVSAANTLGAVLGAAAAGFLLVPLLGTKASIAVVAVIFVMNGAVLGRSRIAPKEPILALAVVAVLSGIDLLLPYRVVLNYNQKTAVTAEVVYHAEGPSATIDLTRTPSDEEGGRAVTSLVIGGNVEADDSRTQLRHFVLKAHLPLLFLDSPRDVLVIGLGMGLTLHSTLGHPGVEHVQVVELSREIYRAHNHLRDVTQGSVFDTRVSVRIDDGRNYLKFSDSRYDMITADPIHPKVTGVGYLYTREYYESIRSHLRPGGVVCQWMPIYQLSPRSLRSAFKSFLAVFPQATFWYVKNHGLFVARDGAPTLEWGALQKKLSDANVRRDLESIDAATPEDLLSLLLLGPEEARQFVDADPDAPLNTDDFPYLEYQAPREVFCRPRENVIELLKFAKPRPDLIRNIPDAVARRIEALCRSRSTTLIDELDER